MRAVLADCIECVRVLLEQGADVNAVSDAPRSIQAGNQSLGSLTPLLLAAPKSNVELIRMLLDHGVSVDAREARGLTPLIRAATGKSQNPQVVRLLLSKGVKPGAQAADGATAASWAEKWGRNQPPDTAVVLATGHSARDAAAHAISLLQASNATYFKRTGCVGCHHQMLSAIAISAARDCGLSADENPASQLRAMLVATKRPLREELFERVSHGLSPIESSLFLIALASLQYSSDSLTDALCHDLAGVQHADGFWEPLGHRQPMVYSRLSATAYAIWALELYGSPGRRNEMNERISRARRWLATATPVHTEERVMQLLGLHWANGERALIDELAASLARLQQNDGGWAQRDGFPSDAYATGETLYALHIAAGTPTSALAYQRGVSFLVNSQHEDGAWYVRSRSVKFQPYFESGFPYGNDQWISTAGTSLGSHRANIGG